VNLPSTFPNGPEFTLAGVSSKGYETIPRPGSFFKLVFSNSIYETIVSHTNEYAKWKEAGSRGKRNWEEIQIVHLKIWLGIVIYMGVHGPKSRKMSNFWRLDDHGPINRHVSIPL
jgi:hypothetical protein